MASSGHREEDEEIPSPESLVAVDPLCWSNVTPVPRFPEPRPPSRVVRGGRSFFDHRDEEIPSPESLIAVGPLCWSDFADLPFWSDYISPAPCPEPRQSRPFTLYHVTASCPLLNVIYRENLQVFPVLTPRPLGPRPALPGGFCIQHAQPQTQYYALRPELPGGMCVRQTPLRSNSRAAVDEPQPFEQLHPMDQLHLHRANSKISVRLELASENMVLSNPLSRITQAQRGPWQLLLRINQLSDRELDRLDYVRSNAGTLSRAVSKRGAMTRVLRRREMTACPFRESRCGTIGMYPMEVLLHVTLPSLCESQCGEVFRLVFGTQRRAHSITGLWARMWQVVMGWGYRGPRKVLTKPSNCSLLQKLPQSFLRAIVAECMWNPM